MDFFYDDQFRRYINQFLRIFGSFSVRKGYDANGNPRLEQVPARYATDNRQVLHILKDNTENTMNVIPIISCSVANLNMFPENRRFPQFEETVQVNRSNPEEGSNDAYTVTRYMPVPYMLDMTVDIWTSNMEQKLQLLEQILVLFNPTINLFTNQNAIDWTRLAYVTLTGTNWSSRTHPLGADEQIDVTSLSFEMPILLTPPAKVQHQQIIHTIINRLNMPDLEDINSGIGIHEWTKETFEKPRHTTTYTIVTLNDYRLGLTPVVDTENQFEAQLMNFKESEVNWANQIFEYYGDIRTGTSFIRLLDAIDDTEFLDGTIEFKEGDETTLIVTFEGEPDDTPGLTRTINRVDPTQFVPSSLDATSNDGDISNGILPKPEDGDRYLLTARITKDADWNSEIVFEKDDIIEFDLSNKKWNVIDQQIMNQNVITIMTDYHINEDDERVENPGGKYIFRSDGWVPYIERIYEKGFWRVYI